MARARRLWMVIPAALVGILAVGAMLLALLGPAPLLVVQKWTASRNAGDVDLAMSYLADDTELFDASMATERGQAKIRDILAAQAIAEWTIQESGCSADGDEVTCRYQMDDTVLRRWGISFFGRHEYVIENGKVAKLARFHDKASRDEAYAALADFKEWVRREHPDLLYVIWSDAQSVTYATPEGAAAMLDLLDEYSPP